MSPLLDLATRLEAATDITGKPPGRHMIESQRMIAKLFGKSDDEEARNIAEVADCMATCIENEMRLFEDLKAVALEVVAELRARSANEAGR